MVNSLTKYPECGLCTIKDWSCDRVYTGESSGIWVSFTVAMWTLPFIEGYPTDIVENAFMIASAAEGYPHSLVCCYYNDLVCLNEAPGKI